jgi:hypothetical protein
MRVLSDLMLWHGKPTMIRSDNGSEFTSMKFISWVKANGTHMHGLTPLAFRRKMTATESCLVE